MRTVYPKSARKAREGRGGSVQRFLTLPEVACRVLRPVLVDHLNTRGSLIWHLFKVRPEIISNTSCIYIYILGLVWMVVLDVGYNLNSIEFISQVTENTHVVTIALDNVVKGALTPDQGQKIILCLELRS